MQGRAQPLEGGKMKNKLAITTALVGVVALAALLAFTGPAQATYPGANGRLAFGMTVDGNTDVYSVLPNGENLRRLTTNPGFDACPAYSADGRQITWCSGILLGSGAGTIEIFKMKANGHDQEQVTHMGGFATFPDFSPDGSKIAFTGRPPGSSNPDVYVINSDGTGLERLTTADGFDGYPAWSPDGSKIVFESARTGVQQVWLMNSDGSNQTQLTFDSVPKDQTPDWSPDGSKIAYTADTNPPGGDIMVMNADGGDQHAITQGPHDYGPVWSPDGTKLALLDLATRDVEVINADGSGRYIVHHGPGPQFVPAWQPHPDEDNG
jgi:Tol biopolymer transport system component